MPGKWKVAAAGASMAISIGMAAAPVSGGSPAASAGSGASVQRVSIVMTEFRFEPRRVAVRPGSVRFDIRNRGVIPHDFLVVGMEHKDHANHLVKPGRGRTDTVTLKPGRYVVVCTVPGHREAGMHLELVVSS
jgi:uncharacterized cupredoxin-like copper-binding protein